MPIVEGTMSINPVTALETFVPPTGPNAVKEAYEIIKAATAIPVSVTGPSLAAAREGIASIARATAAMVLHVQANAVVTTTLSVTSVGGVTTGAGVSGPGTGSGSGTLA